MMRRREDECAGEQRLATRSSDPMREGAEQIHEDVFGGKGRCAGSLIREDFAGKKTLRSRTRSP